MKRKQKRPNYQFMLGGGYKSLPNLNINSDQFIMIANSFYRMGENFDVGLQYRFTSNNGYTKTLFGKNEHRIQLALVYSFDKIFNKQFGDRDQILNLEHSYIK